MSIIYANGIAFFLHMTRWQPVCTACLLSNCSYFHVAQSAPVAIIFFSHHFNKTNSPPLYQVKFTHEDQKLTLSLAPLEIH